MNHTKICWVVALKPEAKPLIEKFQMKQVQIKSGVEIPTWRSECGNHWLVLSGVGRRAAVNAAYAIGFFPGNSGFPAFINFGIAGHKTLELGSVIRASKISDDSNSGGKPFYPAAWWPRKLRIHSVPLMTVKEPTESYPENGAAVDMEAAGFVESAARFASTEFIQSIKVISDNGESSFNNVNSKMVTSMCREAIDSLEPWIEAYQEGAALAASATDLPPDYDEILELAHFSETQTHQLRRVLTRRAALELELPWENGEAPRSSREIISLLKS